VLKLDEVDDDLHELDPLLFGTLIHDVLADFASDRTLASSSEVARIESALTAMLAAKVRATFGSKPLPAVPVQIEQLKRRLSLFALWQAKRVCDGWRIEKTEFSVSNSHSELALGEGIEPMHISARIDRLDYHAGNDTWMIIDYKSGNKPVGPEDALHKTKGWLDLQLPLYQLLLSRELGEQASISTCYVNLSQDELSERASDWSTSQLEDALTLATEIARAVRRNSFWPPGPPGGFRGPLEAFILERQQFWNQPQAGR
jgi:ATP-dependent helicase/DNAse subunit B